MNSVIVVGSGFAGLSAAIELAQRGLHVRVVEAQGEPGGRAQAFAQDGFTFDTGPTLLVMVDVLRSVLGEPAFGNLQLRRLEPGYRVLWPDGEHFDLHSNLAFFLEELSRFEPAGRRHRALDYLADVHGQYVQSRSKVLEVDRTLASFARTVFSPGTMRPQMFGGLRKFVEKSFAHPRVVQALTFQTLYLGLSPLRSPALYALLAVEEIVGGVWYARGGTGAVVRALVDRALQLGVEFEFGSTVRTVRSSKGRARAVECDDRTYPADGVVVTADREPAMEALFRTRPARVQYGHSAIVWNVAVDARIDLPHHTVMLPEDPWSAYAQLDRGELPDRPMLYVCNPAVTDPSVAPHGSSSLLVLAPVPNRQRLPEFDDEAFFARVMERVEQHAGPIRSHIRFRRTRGPRQFANDLHLAHGAAFGPDHGLRQMGPLRPSIRHPLLSNVVFAGSGTHPGSGVPLVLISGRLAAQRLARSLA